MSTNMRSTQEADEISFRELVYKMKEWFSYLKTQWIIIVLIGALGGIAGFVYALYQKPMYTATLTFALEEEKSGGTGLAGALGLANSLGIDIGGSAGGAFSGANLIELMKSRTIVQKALLHPIWVNKQQLSLADDLIQLSNMSKGWNSNPALASVHFEPLTNPDSFSVAQDSIMGILWKKITGPAGVLTVAQKDKKISIITVESKSSNELFSKIFTETIAKVVSDFYVETKSKKAKQNLEMLQRQTDSVRSELNRAITGVATANDNTYNLNPALNIRRTPSVQKQVDVQVNTAVLTQLVPNLEMAKLSLRKETPLIQIVDKPVFPLLKEKPGKLKTMLLVGMLSVFITVIFLILRKMFKKLISADFELEPV